jgi:PAS domain S-box-containing protein
MSMDADCGFGALSAVTPDDLNVRQEFVGLDGDCVTALRALRPWMDEHADEIVHEFYRHLMRFAAPRELLHDPQVLARVKAAQTDYLRSLTDGRFDAAYVADRLAIGRRHAAVGLTPQWYLGAYGIFMSLLLPRLMVHYRGQPAAAMAAIKGLIAVMHLDMQLTIDAYVQAAQAALQQHAAGLREEVAAQVNELAKRAHQLDTLYRVSSAASRELDLKKVLAATLPLVTEIVSASGAEVFLLDRDGYLAYADSHALSQEYVELSQHLRFQPGECTLGRVFVTQTPMLVENLAEDRSFLRRDMALACGYRSLLSAPLIAQGTPLGTLQLYGQDAHCCPPDALPFIHSIAEQLAVAIANARLHESLKISEAEYRSLVENTPRLIFRLDPRGRCVFVNQTLQSLLGWEPQELFAAESMRDRLGFPDDWPEAAIAGALQGQVLKGVECRLRHRDGTWRWCSLILYPWYRGGAQLLGVEGMAEDVTEQKRMAQEMARSERLVLAGQLASGLAHEVGTPLNVIAGTAEYLLSELGPDDPRRADLEIIGQEAHRVADLVRRLLGLVRERGERHVPVDLHLLLEHTLRLLDFRFQQEGIAVRRHYAPELPPVLAVRQHLEQVFLNLLVNAWHAMPRGGSITLTTREQGDRALVTIADTGCGIPEEHMGRLFEPFFSTKAPEQGTGLGLAVAHQLMTANGGSIDIASEVDRGTTVTLTLPLATGGQNA